jgi:hypothetical protein
MAVAASRPKLEPPVNEAPLLTDGTQHAPAWAGYHQEVSDQLAGMTVGVTDGSDAAAGQIGEYLSASGSGALTSAAPADRATLTLTAGDWDVSGSALISASTPNATFFQAWLSTAANTPTDPGRAAFQVQTATAGVLGGGGLVVGPVRFSLTASTDVHLGCQANFPGGTTVTASAFIQARRAR